MANSNPFGGLDLMGLLKNMQGNPVTDTVESNPFFKAVTDAFVKPDQPKDLGQLWEMQKDSIALMASNNPNMTEKLTKIAQKQMEVFQEAWKTYEHYAKKAANGETVNASAMQTAQNAMLKAMGNMQQLGQKQSNMSADAADNLQTNMKDSVAELQSLLKKFAPK